MTIQERLRHDHDCVRCGHHWRNVTESPERVLVARYWRSTCQWRATLVVRWNRKELPRYKRLLGTLNIEESFSQAVLASKTLGGPAGQRPSILAQRSIYVGEHLAADSFLRTGRQWR